MARVWDGDVWIDPNNESNDGCLDSNPNKIQSNNMKGGVVQFFQNYRVFFTGSKKSFLCVFFNPEIHIADLGPLNRAF